jgi:hypothetical protein
VSIDCTYASTQKGSVRDSVRMALREGKRLVAAGRAKVKHGELTARLRIRGRLHGKLTIKLTIAGTSHTIVVRTLKH